MPIPIYRIEVWKPGASIACHYITSDALNIHTKEIITDNIGIFSFVLPTVKGTPNSGYVYNDIDVYDLVKIWFGYADAAGLASIPDFVGKISQISAPLASETGYVRSFVGKSLGEILKRRIKRNTLWQNVDASVIVTELANDLGLGTGQIETDTTDVTLFVEAESYFDVLKKVSDHWVSSDVQIKKDFYVDVNNNLVWKSRPFRTSDIETFIVGQNIIRYDVLKDLEGVKNNILTYGTAGKIGVPGEEGRCQPSDKDGWTESTAGWTLDLGASLTAESSAPKIGTYNLAGVAADYSGTRKLQFHRTVSIAGIGLEAYQTLNFYKTIIFGSTTSNKVFLYAPNSSNCFYATFTQTGSWTFQTFQLGENQEYDADENPNGSWHKAGSPNWQNLNQIHFYYEGTGSFTIYLDGLFFGHGRYRSSALDSGSQTNYGIRDLIIADNTLKSDNECKSRAETLLYQLKDPPTRIDLTVLGNTNLKVGDRLNQTIPAEDINAQAFDVVAVEHNFSDSQGFITKAATVNSVNKRAVPSLTTREAIQQQLTSQKQVARGIQII